MDHELDMPIPDVDALKKLVRDIPDFPKPGILFKDITPLLAHPAGLSMAVEYLTQPWRHTQVDLVVGAESRGFIFGTAIARNLSAGFVPIRKPGKLPHKTRRAEYDLEYGTDALEMHEDAIRPNSRVLMIDDLLATGGTMQASIDLVARCDCRIIGCSFLIELDALKGRERLSDYEVHSVIHY